MSDFTIKELLLMLSDSTSNKRCADGNGTVNGRGVQILNIINKTFISMSIDNVRFLRGRYDDIDEYFNAKTSQERYVCAMNMLNYLQNMKPYMEDENFTEFSKITGITEPEQKDSLISNIMNWITIVCWSLLFLIIIFVSIKIFSR